jgi:hypothetical protein
MNQDFDHLLARERAARGREEEEREPATRSPARAARSGGDGLAGGGRVARGGALLRAWFR